MARLRLRSAWWGLLALRAARAGLRRGGVEAVRLLAVPSGTHSSPREIRAVLRLRRATCLESALVRQALLAAHGEPRDVVVGVTAPSDGFHAHAWLEGEPASEQFTELARFKAR